jgi:hypothetical protein
MVHKSRPLKSNFCEEKRRTMIECHEDEKKAILISRRHCTCHRLSLECINFNETASSNDVCHRKADIMETSFIAFERTFYSHLKPFMMHIDDRNSLLSSRRKSADMLQTNSNFIACFASLKSDNKFLSISNYNFVSFSNVDIVLCCFLRQLMVKDLRRRCTIAFYEFDCSISFVIKH